MSAPSQETLVTSRASLPVEKMPGHWLLAKLGKRVLRPGGLELTRRLLTQLSIGAGDDVVEFAPGLGLTARMTLARCPKSYTAIERDSAVAATVQTYLFGTQQRCIVGSAAEVPLPSASASVVYGEAMLSMQPASTKSQIVAEAARLLRTGGKYGTHELCLTPDDVDDAIREGVAHDLSDEIHVGVRPLTVSEWRDLLTSAGLTVVAEHRAPMHLLEPLRLIRDEGWFGACRFAWNVACNAAARHRVRTMCTTFRKYRGHLAAVMLVAKKT